jgi:hypothetical protein
LDRKEPIKVKSSSSKEASSTMPIDGAKIQTRTSGERVPSQYLQTPFTTLGSSKIKPIAKPKRGRKKKSNVEEVSFTF